MARIHQNGIWSAGTQVTVPPARSGEVPVTLNPHMLSLVVGETRTVQPLDPNGQPVTGLTWTASDTTIVSLSIDDPPVITAVAAGHATVTAGNASVDITVYPGPFLPTGTIQWSNPGDGSGVSGIVPAVPSASGVADVFSFQNSGKMQAVTSDGTVAWTADLSTASNAIPDFQGGLIAVNQNFGSGQTSLRKLDGMTGQPSPSYTLTNPSYTAVPVLPHTDGTIFTLDGSKVVGIDPKTGQAKFSVLMDQSVGSGNGNCGEYTPFEVSSAPEIGVPIIAGDGYFYVPYAYSVTPLAANQKICNRDGSETGVGHTDVHLRMLRVGTYGSSSKIIGGDWQRNTVLQCVLGMPFDRGAECYSGHFVGGSSGDIPNLGPLIGKPITNADQGVQYSWTLQFGSNVPTYNFSSISTGGAVSTTALATAGPVTPVLQFADGSYSGTVPDGLGNSIMVRVNQSGSLSGSVPGSYSPMIATADGGVIAQNSSGASVIFDQNGAIIGQLASPPLQTSLGNEYQLGSVDLLARAPIDLATGFWSAFGGNLSLTAVAVHQDQFAQLDTCLNANGKTASTCPGSREAIFAALKRLIVIRGQSDRSFALQTNVFDKLSRTKAALSAYLNKGAEFYDGTKSQVTMSDASLASGFKKTVARFFLPSLTHARLRRLRAELRFEHSSIPKPLA